MRSERPPAGTRRAARRLARASTACALACTLAVGLPVVATLAPTAPLPSPVALGAETDVRLDQPSRPVRVRVPYAGIDLPVVSSERNVRGNRQGYPLCDVAQYWTRYELPGAPGTTWIYAHAQEGMFLPLFTISEATDGRGLLGKVVTLQTRDKRLLRYRINEVKERARTVSIARRDDKQDQRLILQTSTGPPGTIPKLQVAAELIDAREATEPAPKAQPRACWQPRPKATPKRNGTASPTATPAPAEVVETEEPIGGVALVVGSGAILLGATFLAVYIVRRP